MIPEIAPQRLCRLIAGFAPASVLCLGDGERILFEACRAALPQCRVEVRDDAPTLDELEKATPHDLILVAGLLERMPRAEAEQLLARLRDLGAPRLIVALPPCGSGTPAERCWKPADLFALGFTLLGDLEAGDAPLRLYAFDIAAYKTTPDWLNSRYWAHPELFGKYWW